MLQGNIILTDSKYEILTLLRSYRDDDKGVAIMSRHPYPIRTIRPRAMLASEALTTALVNADDKATLKGQPSSTAWPKHASLCCRSGCSCVYVRAHACFVCLKAIVPSTAHWQCACRSGHWSDSSRPKSGRALHPHRQPGCQAEAQGSAPERCGNSSPSAECAHDAGLV